jgi:hypothetical protein
MINMKNIFVAIAFLSLTNLVTGQITITDATFPAAGDTLNTATDNSPEGIVITGAGGPFTWDYSSLNADAKLSTPFRPAAEGMAFASYPTAELVVILDAGAETYYDVSSTAFSNLGISGSEILSGFPLDADLKFVPPLKERVAPLSYPAVNNSESSLTIAIPLSALPGDLLDSLGIPTGFIDSIGVKLTITRTDFVDAFGTLSIPGGTYDVLRQKRTDYSDTRLEVYNSLLGWQDVTDLLPIDGFGQDTTISYEFLSNTEKEPIAIITMDSTGLLPSFADFKDNGVTSAIENPVIALSAVSVYPNPVSDLTTISFKPESAERYTLRLFDANGSVVLSKDVSSGFEQFSMSSYSAGAYTYQIYNGNGQVMASGKLIKIKS